jgi:hypothetical protein
MDSISHKSYLITTKKRRARRKEKAEKGKKKQAAYTWCGSSLLRVLRFFVVKSFVNVSFCVQLLYRQAGRDYLVSWQAGSIRGGQMKSGATV